MSFKILSFRSKEELKVLKNAKKEIKKGLIHKALNGKLNKIIIKKDAITFFCV